MSQEPWCAAGPEPSPPPPGAPPPAAGPPPANPRTLSRLRRERFRWAAVMRQPPKAALSATAARGVNLALLPARSTLLPLVLDFLRQSLARDSLCGFPSAANHPIRLRE